MSGRALHWKTVGWQLTYLNIQCNIRSTWKLEWKGDHVEWDLRRVWWCVALSGCRFRRSVAIVGEERKRPRTVRPSQRVDHAWQLQGVNDQPWSYGRKRNHVPPAGVARLDGPPRSATGYHQRSAMILSTKERSHTLDGSSTLGRSTPFSDWILLNVSWVHAQKVASITVYGSSALKVLRVKWGKSSSHALGVGLDWYSLHDEEGSKHSDYKCEFHGESVTEDGNRGDVERRRNLGMRKRTSGLLYIASAHRHEIATLRPPAKPP